MHADRLVMPWIAQHSNVHKNDVRFGGIREAEEGIYKPKAMRTMMAHSNPDSTHQIISCPTLSLKFDLT